MNISTLSTLVAVLLGVLTSVSLYALLIPKKSGQFAPDNKEETQGNPLLRVATVLGKEIYTALPETAQKGGSDKSIARSRDLLIKSGNPWGLNPEEFAYMRWIMALFGLIAGCAAYAVMRVAGVVIPWYVIVPLTAIFGFFIPLIVHKEKAAKRDLDFKRHLPEALDLMVISLSAGKTLNQAMRDSVDNITPGILRDEFVQIVRSLDSGKSMHDSLDEFADRAPSDGVITFVRAVQEANDLNVQMKETLIARAEASREELFSLIHKRTAALPVKIGAVLTPTLLASLLIVVMAPFLIYIMEIL